MRIPHRLLAIPLLLTASAVSALGDVRDKAGLFSPEAIERANAELARVTRETKIPVTIETVPSLRGMPIGEAIAEYAKGDGVRGLFILIPKAEGKVKSDSSREYHHYFSRPQYDSIDEAFAPGFRKRDFDAGLAQGVAHIASVLPAIAKSAPAAAARQPIRGQMPAQVPGRMPAQAKSGLPVLIGIVLLVLGVVIVFRLLGALFGAGRGGYGPGSGPGQMRGGPGYGPGYGGPGYGGGGGGGGFMSSLFGGLGGAMAGNWLYDQFGRRHSPDQAGYAPGAEPTAPADAGPDWQGAEGGGADWGGGDAGGGGGADWGGGAGGGGGDWGGGGGGGDWGGGGGGDGGGSW